MEGYERNEKGVVVSCRRESWKSLELGTLVFKPAVTKPVCTCLNCEVDIDRPMSRS